MKNLIAQGISQKLIRLEDNNKYIVYIHQNKRRNFDNPEEKVQTEAFLSLVLDYKYPPQRLRQFVSVQMGSETKEADIIVFDDDLCLAPLIVVECKKQEVTELEFQRASDQCFSYAVAEGAKYAYGGGTTPEGQKLDAVKAQVGASYFWHCLKPCSRNSKIHSSVQQLSTKTIDQSCCSMYSK